MKLKAPKNGRPMHLSEPPIYIRSAREMRKNLIILASAVAAILLIVILSLVGAASSQRAAEEAVQAKIQAEKDRIAAEEEAARQAEEAARVTLDDDELSVVAGMFEAYRAVVQDAESSSARIVGDNVKIKVESTPSGARIYNADGSFRGVTPYEITERMDGSREEKWTFRLEGYEDQKVDVRIAKSMNPVIVTLEKGGSAAVVAPDPEPAPKPAAKPAAKSSSKSSAKSSGKSSGGKKKPGGKRLLL